MNDWPFDQQENSAAITTKGIVFEGEPVLLVFHDADDHGWQFLGMGAFNMENSAIVSMSDIVKLDSTVLEVAHMEPGWFASREHVGAKWNIEKSKDQGS